MKIAILAIMLCGCSATMQPMSPAETLMWMQALQPQPQPMPRTIHCNTWTWARNHATTTCN